MPKQQDQPLTPRPDRQDLPALDIDNKRELDAEFTGQLLKVTEIADELVAYANRFIELFHTDDYDILGIAGLKIHQLCELAVKGGLGAANLEARFRPHPPDTLVWEGYVGDCDLNLLIKRDGVRQILRAPGLELQPNVGVIMAAVAQRIKILLTKAIADTAYRQAAWHIWHGRTIEPPLYRCNQVEALAHLLDFVVQDLPVSTDFRLPPNGPPGEANYKPLLKILTETSPWFSLNWGPGFDAIFKIISGSGSNDWLVYDSREKDLLFLCDLNKVRSSWTDVDLSFFPYAPGRMDALGAEVSELAIRQATVRQDLDAPETLPYDVFKVVSTDFRYSSRDNSNAPVPDHDNQVHTADERLSLSMYANDLIDDFLLIRAALKFPGIAVQRQDVNAARRAGRTEDYSVKLMMGAAKCEFVDVAVPRIGSPEWAYLQDRPYYFEAPQQSPAGAWDLRIGNFEYQTEENLNLLIELGCGLSHSEHKAYKRIWRLLDMWIRCDSLEVFPRVAGGNLPRGANAAWEAPVTLVRNLIDDYQNLYSLSQLPDWIYNEVFLALRALHQAALVADHRSTTGARPNAAEITTIKDAAMSLGRTGLTSMPVRATHDDAAAVTTLRALIEDGQLEVNWVGACWLLLKASTLPDVIWFPRMSVFKALDANEVNNAFAAGGLSLAGALANDDTLAMIWDSAPSNPNPLSFFTIPAADFADANAPFPVVFYGRNLDSARQRITRELRGRLLRANNQMLRVSYGSMLNTLQRSAADSFLDDLLR